MESSPGCQIRQGQELKCSCFLRTKNMVTIMPLATFAEVFTVRSRGRGIGQQKSHLDHDLQCNVAVGTYLGIKESSGGVKLCRGVLFVAIRHGATSGFADAIQSTTESSMLSRAHLLGLHERRSPGRTTAEQISLLLARVLFYGRLIVRPYLLQLVAHQRHKLPNLGFVRGCVVTERAYKVSRHLDTACMCRRFDGETCHMHKPCRLFTRASSFSMSR